MFNIPKSRVPIILGAIPLFGNKFDVPIKDLTKELSEDETGIDRIKLMFSRDKNYEISPELGLIRDTFSTSFIVGGILGGIRHTKETVPKFIENNQGTPFRSHVHAKIQLQNEVMKKFCLELIRHGIKTALFTTIFLTTSCVLSAYRGYPRFYDFTAGAAFTGCLFRCTLGLRGAIAGSIVGGFLGTIGGALGLGLLSIAGLQGQYFKHWEAHIERRQKLRLQEENMQIQDEKVQLVLPEEGKEQINDKKMKNEV